MLNPQPLPPLRSPGLRLAARASLSVLLGELGNAFSNRGLRWCVLRHHEHLGELDGDLDLLVEPRSHEEWLAALYTVRGLRITSIMREADSAHVFASHAVLRGVHLHLAFALTWRGQPYLDAARVLDASVPFTPHVRVASSPMRAVNTLLEHLLWHGRVKLHDVPDIRNGFRQHRDETERLLALFGHRLAARLIERVLADRFDSLPRLAPALRRRLLAHSLRTSPRQTIARAVRYAWTNLMARLRPANVFVVAVLGVDGAGKTTLAHELVPALRNVAGRIESHRVRPHILYDRSFRRDAVSALRPHAARPQSRAFSTAKFVTWIVELWINRFAVWRYSSAVQIFDRYYHDVLVDPRRYRCRLPFSFLRLLSRAALEPDLWVLLDAPSEVLFARKQDLRMGEVAQQREEYRALLGGRRHVAIVRADQPIARVVADLREAIVARMSARYASPEAI